MSVLNFVPVFDEAFSGLPHGPLNDLSGALENPTEERKLFKLSFLKSIILHRHQERLRDLIPQIPPFRETKTT